eukprot:CAMPEP_0185196094 /NCGR_PEP_ID=MMETSP1140-20130426/36594_1 /TAXON_ID=298111 /ORGANISM="Pavlova sp., Strain CCMP459" /LENGTH=48 /DNA_ID= /DNA_START= /DNA_END= /DNA_ORIENTATION=
MPRDADSQREAAKSRALVLAFPSWYMRFRRYDGGLSADPHCSLRQGTA